MSVAASFMAIADAGITHLDAIVTGTSLGCSEDTHEFLKSIVKDNETLLSPTAFIKSTHNTIGGQIALMGNYNGYNMTYASRSFSFESALLDGTMLMQEGANNVLVGGIDELTDTTIKLLQRLGCIAGGANTQAPPCGEGAVFMTLGNNPSASNYAVLNKVHICKGSNPTEAMAQFIEAHPVDLVLTGANTLEEYDTTYAEALKAVLPAAAIGYYKHLCGDYHTSTSVATMLGAMMLKTAQVPSWAMLKGTPPNCLESVLLYNRTPDGGHSFIHLAKC